MKLLYRQIYLNFFALIALSAIGLLGVFFIIEINQVHKANLWVSHTQQTIQSSYKIIENIYFIETAANKFVLTKNPNYLNNYESGVKEINQNIIGLKELTIDNPAQQARILQLKNLISQRFIILNSTIDIRKNHDFQFAIHYEKIRSHNPSLNQLLNLAKLIVDEENKLLLSRKAVLYSDFLFTTQIAIWVDVGSIFVILMCLIFLNKQLITRFATERKLHSSQKELEKLAYFDPLTGLNNRVTLIKKIKEMIEAQSSDSNSIALLYVDLDNFKNINDNLGHEMGDQFLKEISARLEKIYYPNKFISRISGDEFVVLINNLAHEDDINLIIQNIFTLVSDPIRLSDQEIVCTASVGVCLFPQFAKDENSLLKNADIALYKAKQLGKNNYQFCNHEMIREYEKRIMVQANLSNAIINKEFTIEYQPKLALLNNEISGVEALIRWVRPNVGLVYPGEFIDYAENNGLIVSIGEWLLKNVCEQVQKWEKSGIDIHVAINVSTREFAVHDFAHTIIKLLNDLTFDPAKLEIEITETMLMKNSKNIVKTLQHLKSLGVQITVDDFGTGYSTLSYLNLFPIDKIKIDKSFVDRIDDKSNAASIVSSIITMAHSLGIKVIAEGVETPFQFQFLKDNHCDEIQGFYYCKPLSSDDLMDFYKTKMSSINFAGRI